MATDTARTWNATERRAPASAEEAPRSWWLDADTRQSFAEAVEREEARMRRSRAARLVGAMVVGQIEPRGRR